MTLLCIIVYNRFKNLQHWLDCWEKCDKGGTQVVVIHNFDQPKPEYKQLCDSHGALYIPRKNIGFDIGAFQDVCRNRLEGFPRAWDKLLWVTDDTFPMTPNFVKQFESSMAPGIGVACMDLNPYVRQHIRTTGFMITRPLAERLQFPQDPITTKEHCYQFEHRDDKMTFLAQIHRMGYRVRQTGPAEISPLWDTGYHRKLDRQEEHDNIFGEKPTKFVTFICPIFKSYPYIIPSLLAQTNPNWKLLLIHDGPGQIQNISQDPRITFLQTAERRQHYGHPIRQEYLPKIDTEYVVLTNADNYHVPVYVEHMMRSFTASIVGVYCSQMVHSYKAWQTIDCSLHRGYIDCAGMMLRTKEAQEVGWNHIEDPSSDWFFFNDLIRKYGVNRFKKIPGCLLIHN